MPYVVVDLSSDENPPVRSDVAAEVDDVSRRASGRLVVDGS